MPGLALLLALVLLPTGGRGITMRGVTAGTMPVFPGGACTSPVRMINITGGGWLANVYSNAQAGQSFTATVSKPLSHVIFNYNSLDAAASPLFVRLDDDVDMTSEYMAGVSLATTGTGQKTFTFDPATRPSVTNGQVYYLLTGTSTTNSSAIIRQNANTYADGTLITAPSAWNATGSTAGDDVDVEVWYCP